MTATYAKGTLFASAPIGVVKTLLSGWSEGVQLADIAERKGVGLPISTAAAIMDEALVQGLLVRRDGLDLDTMPGRESARYAVWNQNHAHPFLVTPDGGTVIDAELSAPISRRRGLAILNGLLKNCQEVNENGFPFFVERVWLYGSLARDAERVNDVDVVIEIDRNGMRSIDPSLGERMIALARKIAGNAYRKKFVGSAHIAAEYLEKVLVVGKAKNPRLSVGDTETILSLGCPCRLVFDASRGGPVDDPILPMHPESSGRDPENFDPLVMPKLIERATLKPVEPLFVVGESCPEYPVWNYLLNDYESLVRIGASDNDGNVLDFTLQRDDEEDIAEWSVARKVGVLDDGTYDCSVRVRKGKLDEGMACEESIRFVKDLVAADVERAAMHALSTGSTNPSLTITVYCGENELLMASSERLSERIVSDVENDCFLGSFAARCFGQRVKVDREVRARQTPESRRCLASRKKS